MAKTQKNDFIELKFTGRVKEGEIFDTNLKEDAEKIELKLEEKPLIICIGQEMVIIGFDKALEDKETDKQYSIELEQEEAFGERKKDLIKLIPKKIFLEKQIDPRPGMVLNLDDNTIVRIASVSGGRVLVDFNSPLAGKTIIYDFKIKQVVTDINEKVNAIMDYFLKNRLKFEIKEKKIIFKAKEFFKPAIEELGKKFGDILGYEFDLEDEGKEKKEVKEKKEEVKQETKSAQ